MMIDDLLSTPPPIEVVVKAYHSGTSKHRYFGMTPSRSREPPLADEVLGEEQADWFIDVAKAKATARKAFAVLSNYLAARDVVVYDLCLFITEDGETVFGEISQDCGRFRHFSLGSLDKDEWRAGGSSELVMRKWQMLLEMATTTTTGYVY